MWKFDFYSWPPLGDREYFIVWREDKIPLIVKVIQKDKEFWFRESSGKEYRNKDGEFPYTHWGYVPQEVEE